MSLNGIGHRRPKSNRANQPQSKFFKTVPVFKSFLSGIWSQGQKEECIGQLSLIRDIFGLTAVNILREF